MVNFKNVKFKEWMEFRLPTSLSDNKLCGRSWWRKLLFLPSKREFQGTEDVRIIKKC